VVSYIYNKSLELLIGVKVDSFAVSSKNPAGLTRNDMPVIQQHKEVVYLGEDITVTPAHLLPNHLFDTFGRDLGILPPSGFKFLFKALPYRGKTMPPVFGHIVPTGVISFLEGLVEVINGVLKKFSNHIFKICVLMAVFECPLVTILGT
jgi:hypothetical protein